MTLAIPLVNLLVDWDAPFFRLVLDDYFHILVLNHKMRRLRLFLRVLPRLQDDIVHTSLEVYERCIPLDYRSFLSMLVSHYFS